MVDNVRNKKIGVEKGGLVGVDSMDMSLHKFVGRAEIVDIAVDDSIATDLHRI